MQVGADQNVFQHGQAGKWLHDLECPRDAAARQPIRRFTRNDLAGITDIALAWFEEAGDDGEQRCLAGAVRPDQRSDPSLRAVSEAPFTANRPPNRPVTRSTTRSGSAIGLTMARLVDRTNGRRARRVNHPALFCAQPPIRPRGVNQMTSISTAPYRIQIQPGHISGDELRTLAQPAGPPSAPSNRPEDRADATDNRRQQSFNRDPCPVGNSGIDEQKLSRVKAPAAAVMAPEMTMAVVSTLLASTPSVLATSSFSRTAINHAPSA